MLLRQLRLAIYSLFLLMCFSAKATNWPYPQDTPESTPVNVGMASDRPVDISRFLLARGASNGRVNSSVSHVAYISNVTGIRQLWVTSINGGQATQLTYGNGITFFRWHPDGKHILYGADNNGDEKEAYYLISMDGLSEELTLAHSPAYRSFGEFNHDGSVFSYASTERNGRDFDLYVYDFSNQQSRIIYQAEFGYFPAKWRPNSNQLLVTQTRGEDAQNLYLLDSKTGSLTTIFKPEIAAAYESFNWTSDGKGFYFSSNQHGEMMEIHYYDMASKKTQTVSKANYDLQDIMLCDNNSSLLWMRNENGFESLYISPVGQFKPSHIATSPGVMSLSCGNTPTVLINHSGPHTPNNIQILNTQSKQVTPLLTAQMAGISAKELVSPEAVKFAARDKVEIRGLLYLPTTKGKHKPAIVIDVHGGPTSQAKASWQPLTQYLVGKGIAVLDINVRGSTGYGKTFMRLDNQEKRLDSVRDLVDAVEWLKMDGRVDGTRAAVMGGSYGGYMVNAVMGAYPDVFDAGASFVGVANWVRALQTASPGLKASDLIEYGDIRQQRWQQFYADNSPINTVNKITAPMFFEHGVNDPRDPVTESDTMVKALRDKGIDVTYLRFPDEGHSVAKLENRVTFYRQLAAFLEQHLKQK